jgi:hypothetical protein
MPEPPSSSSDPLAESAAAVESEPPIVIVVTWPSCVSTEVEWLVVVVLESDVVDDVELRVVELDGAVAVPDGLPS